MNSNLSLNVTYSDQEKDIRGKKIYSILRIKEIVIYSQTWLRRSLLKRIYDCMYQTIFF